MKAGAIRACAEWILRLGSGQPEKLGNHWFPRWAKRHSLELHSIKDKVIANDRKSAGSAEDIKEWFELLAACVEEYDIDNGDIWDFDETCFAFGDHKDSCVVWVPRDIKAVYQRTPANRKLIACVECISARGESLPTFFIVKGARIMERWLADWKDQDHDLLDCHLGTPRSVGVTWQCGYIVRLIIKEEKEFSVPNAI